ncbi:MAG: DrmB family protein [Clostridium sp.]
MTTLKENYTLFGRKIRASNVVFPFGVGAMIDLPEGVFMTTSCDKWNPKNLTIIHDERLEKVLNVKGFKTPVVKGEDEENKNVFIPLVQFPEWMFCPKCRKFQSLKEWEKQYKSIYGKEQVMRKNICSKCRVKLSPARIVIACKNGHIDDFPWVQWVHYKNNKKVCPKPDIYIKTSGVTSGLEGIKVECRNCNCKTNLANTFNKNINVFQELEKKAIKEGFFQEEYSLECRANRPWDDENDKCGEYPTVLQRGATNIYFPKVESSILIPPYSEKVNIVIEESSSYNSMIISIESLKASNMPREIIENLVQSYYQTISNEVTLPIEVVKTIVNRKLDDDINDTEELESRTRYKEEEYKALIGEFGYKIMDQKDFRVEVVDGKKYLDYSGFSYINNVVLIHKLKEIRALVGFTRLHAPDSNIMEIDEESGKSEVIKPLKDTSWYPAMEVRGEGIFIELKEEVINKWISSNDEISKRADDLDKKYNKILSERGHSERRITSKFLLLHTLAHVIIKELSFKCGYSSTSLRERIYCNGKDSDYHMNGILIYTANGDSEGTLGGLVRQGRVDKLPYIINSAIEKARFCSSDPVCIESKGQGRDALNLSACYSCTLVAETSCEEFNTLLDRAMLVGTLEDQAIGFFNYV